MSQPPSPINYDSTRITIRPGPQNTLGLIGFIFVMVGVAGFCMAPLFFFGLVGTVLCGIAVFKEPRGLALAGLIVGLVETLFALVVVVVIGLLIGGAAVAGKSMAQRVQTMTAGQATRTAIDAYRAEHHALPGSLAEVPNLMTVAKDGWGQPLRYVPDAAAGTYELISDGPDGRAKTSDDIVVTDVFAATTAPTTEP